jgi:hypothetical protein
LAAQIETLTRYLNERGLAPEGEPALALTRCSRSKTTKGSGQLGRFRKRHRPLPGIGIPLALQQPKLNHEFLEIRPLKNHAFGADLINPIGGHWRIPQGFLCAVNFLSGLSRRVPGTCPICAAIASLAAIGAPKQSRHWLTGLQPTDWHQAPTGWTRSTATRARRPRCGASSPRPGTTWLCYERQSHFQRRGRAAPPSMRHGPRSTYSGAARPVPCRPATPRFIPYGSPSPRPLPAQCPEYTRPKKPG